MTGAPAVPNDIPRHRTASELRAKRRALLREADAAELDAMELARKAERLRREANALRIA
jgi:hypothetical protein